MTIWACQAGKDVYVEKPCSHNVHEGRIAVETARKHNRIVQHGTQSRSEPGWAELADVVAVGQARQAARVARPLLQAARQHRHQAERRRRRRSSTSTSGSGPAPEQPYHAQPGPLQLALVLGLRQRRHRQPGRPRDGHRPLGDPRRDAAARASSASAAASATTTRAQTPNTQIAVFDYGDTQLIFEVRGLKTDELPRRRRSATSSTSRRASIAGDKFYPKGKDDRPSRCRKVDGRRDAAGRRPLRQLHRRRPQPQDARTCNADILEGHYSSALCHLANISYRLGEEVPFNAADQGASATTRRPTRRWSGWRSTSARTTA